MRIQILGTAAAEAWPGIFCGCNTCERARAAGGKDLRSRASLQIDDIFKIDLPPDTYLHVIRYGLDLSRLKFLFFTHSHGDHFAPDELEYLRPVFAHNLKNSPVRVYGNSKVVGALQSRAQRHPDWPIKIQEVTPFQSIQADHLTFTSLKASHAPTEQALNYVIQSDTATVLYASDTGLYEDETMEHLSQYKFDLIISECTQGLLMYPSIHHMGFDGVLELRNRLRKAGAVSDNTRCVITHFSHNINLLHADLERTASHEGIEVAYDGIVLEV